jgi:hypothetical protein
MSQSSDNELLDFIEKYDQTNQPAASQSSTTITQSTSQSHSESESGWFHSQASEVSVYESSQSTGTIADERSHETSGWFHSQASEASEASDSSQTSSYADYESVSGGGSQISDAPHSHAQAALSGQVTRMRDQVRRR